MVKVLLGFPDDELTSDCTAYDNFIGGSLVSFSSQEYFPSVVGCPGCGAAMVFMLQLYCPVSDEPVHRHLYFFACFVSACQKSGLCWRVFRLQRKLNATIGNSGILSSSFARASEWVFCDDDDIGDGDNSQWTGVDECLYSARRTQEGYRESFDVSHTVSQLRSPFSRCLLNVYEEDEREVKAAREEEEEGDPSLLVLPEDPKLSDNNLHKWVLDYRAEAEFLEDDDNEMKDAYGILPFSVPFQLHIATRATASYGCEAVRYAWQGEPIFAHAPLDGWASHFVCPNCLSPRIFEVQIFSSINNALRLDTAVKSVSELTSDLRVDWPLDMLTVIVFSCRDSCWRDDDKNCSWLEECVLVQKEDGKSVFGGP